MSDTNQTCDSLDAVTLTDAELEAVSAGKDLLRRDLEGPNGWFIPLPEKLRRRGT